MGRVAKLKMLEAGLRDLQESYGAPRALADADKRRAAYLSLVGVIGFIEAQPGWKGLDFALIELMTALNDVEHGKTVDWLRNPVAKRPPPSITASVLRGKIAAVMELLMQHRIKRRDAAAHILRKLNPSSPIFEGVRNPTWSTIALWRDNVIGSAGESVERESFAAVMAIFAERPGHRSSRRSLEAVLNLLAKIAATTF